jgi:hypothetical protein
MEIILLIAALVCAASSVAAAISLARCLKALEAAMPPGPIPAQEPEPDELRERALREQRRFEEALAGILSYGQADMQRRQGEEV